MENFKLVASGSPDGDPTNPAGSKTVEEKDPNTPAPPAPTPYRGRNHCRHAFKEIQSPTNMLN